MLSISIGNGDEVTCVAGASQSVIAVAEKRAERNALLAQSDSMMVSDRGLSESKLTDWKTYRQKLRDLDVSDPDKITFPKKP